jgi:hypothetical protein
MTLIAQTDSAAPYGTARLPNGAAEVRFSFELLANAIFFDAGVNGKGPHLFALDTGSTNTVIASERIAELGIATGSQMHTSGAGSDMNMAAKIDQLDIALPRGVRRTTTQGTAISMAGLWPLIGRPIYGALGYDIIEPFVVEIDYAKRIVVLHDPATYRYRGSGTTLPVRLYGAYDPQIEGSMIVPGQAPIPVRFTIDTGAGGTIVSSPLVDKYHLLAAVGKRSPPRIEASAVPSRVKCLPGSRRFTSGLMPSQLRSWRCRATLPARSRTKRSRSTSAETSCAGSR